MSSRPRSTSHDATGIVLIEIPGGEFVMGDVAHPRRWANAPPRQVFLTRFFLAKHCVTERLWAMVMNAWPRRSHGDECPAGAVTYRQCQEFCRRTGLKFPTEAQWEYACRSGHPTKHVSIHEHPELGWDGLNSDGVLRPVGSAQPNGFGLYDMLGSVSEWCLDMCNRNFYLTPQAAGQDPVCLVPGTDPPRGITRGGNFIDRGFSDSLLSMTATLETGPVSGFRPAYYELDLRPEV